MAQDSNKVIKAQTKNGAEHRFRRRKSEHVRMNDLPSVILLFNNIIVVFNVVAGKVFLKDSRLTEFKSHLQKAFQ